MNLKISLIISVILFHTLFTEYLPENDSSKIGTELNLPFQSKFKLNLTTDILEGFELAIKENKPILFIFAGQECMHLINDGYNEFDKYLIKSREIREKINNDFVTIYLDVDDQTILHHLDRAYLEKIKLSDKWKGKVLKSKKVGHLNLLFQMDKFQNNAQPMYVILSSKNKILVEPFGSVENDYKLFVEKLNEGIVNSKK